MSNLLYPFMLDNIYFPIMKLHYNNYIVSVNFGKNIPISFGLWGNIKYREFDNWLRIKEYFCADKENKNISYYYNQLFNLIGNRKVDVLINPIDNTSHDFADLLNDNEQISDVIYYCGNQKDYYEKITKALQSGNIKISESCYDTKREHLKCTLNNPFGDNGLMNEIGLFIDYIYKLPTKDTSNDKFSRLVRFITEYHDKIQDEVSELRSDGEWHTVGLLDGEDFALGKIMKKIAEIKSNKV